MSREPGDRPVARVAAELPARTTPSAYPPVFAERMRGRVKQVLGDPFGLRNFGVNRVRMAPGAQSSLRHAHSRQDEFIYVLAGELVLHTDAGEQRLQAGMCAGFAAGSGDAHRLLNRSASDAVYLEVGDRSEGDEVTYPDDDLAAQRVAGGWRFTHKDGRPYD